MVEALADDLNTPLALARLAELLFSFLTTERSLPAGPVAETLWRDYQRGGRRDAPEFLRPFLAHVSVTARSNPRKPISQKRQARHFA